MYSDSNNFDSALISIYDFSVLEVKLFGSILIVDTFIGEIVLLDQVCRSCELENADRNLVDDSYYHYYV